MLPKFSYTRATSIDNALAILDDRPALIHAGGTDLLGCLRDGIFSADNVVSLSAVEELRGIRPVADGGVRIGALTSIADVADDDSIVQRYRALSQAASHLSSSPSRLGFSGTVGLEVPLDSPIH
jgi:xanthine dehydrogenase YagS FAD-binding subunit